MRIELAGQSEVPHLVAELLRAKETEDAACERRQMAEKTLFRALSANHSGDGNVECYLKIDGVWKVWRAKKSSVFNWSAELVNVPEHQHNIDAFIQERAEADAG